MKTNLKGIGQAIWKFFVGGKLTEEKTQAIINAWLVIYQQGYKEAKSGKPGILELTLVLRKSSLDKRTVEIIRGGYQAGWRDALEGRPDRAKEYWEQRLRLLNEQVKILTRILPSL